MNARKTQQTWIADSHEFEVTVEFNDTYIGGNEPKRDESMLFFARRGRIGVNSATEDHNAGGFVTAARRGAAR